MRRRVCDGSLSDLRDEMTGLIRRDVKVKGAAVKSFNHEGHEGKIFLTTEDTERHGGKGVHFENVLPQGDNHAGILSGSRLLNRFVSQNEQLVERES